MLRCSTCDKDMEKDGWTEPPVYHCEASADIGARIAQAHHVSYPPHAPCWKCGAALGCKRCSGPGIDDLFCSKCGLWQTSAGFLTGFMGVWIAGEPPRAMFEKQPQEWQVAWMKARELQPKPMTLTEMFKADLQRRKTGKDEDVPF